MRGAGVGDSANAVRINPVGLSQLFAAFIANIFGVAAFIGRGGITVIDPHERTDFHAVAGAFHPLHPIGGDPNNFAGAQFALKDVFQIRQCTTFQCHRIAVVIFSNNNRCAAHAVARGINSIFGEQQNRGGSLNHLLRPGQAVHKICSLINQVGDQLGGIDLVAAHFRKMNPGGAGFLLKGGRILNHTNGHNGVAAVPRIDEQGLVFVVADDANRGFAAHFFKVVIKFGAELGVSNVVNVVGEVSVIAQRRHTAALGSKM